MNITVHLNDYSLCDDYSGEYTIDIIMNFYSDGIKFGTFLFDSSRLECGILKESNETKCILIEKFIQCLKNNTCGKISFYHCDFGGNSIVLKDGIVQFSVNGNMNDQQHMCALHIRNSENLHDVFSTILEKCKQLK
jgi:hypothetical protein